MSAPAVAAPAAAAVASAAAAPSDAKAAVTLSTPLQLGPYLLPHRVLMASMTRSRGQWTDLHKQYYTQRSHANGGASLILCEHLLIEPQGSEWILAPVLNKSSQVAAFRSVIDAVHAAGSIIFAQLWHGGRCVHPLMQGGQPAMGPSAIKAAGGKFRLLQQYVNAASAEADGVNSSLAERAASADVEYVLPEAIVDPREYVALYANSARLALQAGFDGIEVHGASGFLIHQFLDSSSNKREDEWGGTPENRCRFALAIIDDLVGVFGAQRVGIKIAPCGGYNDVGMSVQDTRDTYSYLVQQLSKREIAYVQVQRYSAEFDGERGQAAFDVRELRKHFSHATGRFILNGDYTPESAGEALAQGDCDAVTFASLFLNNPDLADRVARGKGLVQPSYAHLYGDWFKPLEFDRGYTDQKTWRQQQEEEQAKQPAAAAASDSPPATSSASNDAGVIVSPLSDAPFAVFLNGTVGAGKTSAAEALGELLTSRSIPRAVIDLDALRQFTPSAASDPHCLEVELLNLASVAANYRKAGAQRIILAGVVESAHTQRRYEQALGLAAGQIAFVRLTVSSSEVEQRLRRRHAGEEQEEDLTWHLARAPELAGILDAAHADHLQVHADHLQVPTDGLTPKQVAAQVAQLVGWN